MSIRIASKNDLVAINQVIDVAIMNWPLAERAKRLIMPVLRYSDAEDLDYYQALVWEANQKIVGLATWDISRRIETVNGKANLLHGLYVSPDFQGRGIGKRLIDEVARRAPPPDPSLDGLLIKAERVAVGFFESCGLTQLKAMSVEDYPYQFWKPL